MVMEIGIDGALENTATKVDLLGKLDGTEREAYLEALRRIEHCQTMNETVLDLAGLGLLSLPPEIWQITTLTELDLYDNQLTSLPPQVGQLAALTELDLGGNELTSLPPEIEKLPVLAWLNLGGNELTSLPPEIGKLTALTTLDLSSNGLTSLPQEIGELSALTELDLEGNQLASLLPEIGKLTALTRLDLSSNELTSLPTEIGKLSALTELTLEGNQLKSLLPEIGQLKALTVLDLGVNQLTSLPPEIGQLSAINLLNISNNQLTTLPPQIERLSSLVWLGLSCNQYTVLPPHISCLSALSELELNENQLSTLPPQIGQLSALSKIDLGGNQLTSLPSEIGQLKALITLDVSNNQLNTLPPEIGQLKALTVLDLENNQLTALPPQIGQLKTLTRLYLQCNQLTTLPPQIGQLSKLITLALSGNNLSKLPFELYALTKLRRLWLEGNPDLNIPDTILGAGGWLNEEDKTDPSTILAYYFSRADIASRPLNEVKLLIVGRGGAGKTSTVRALQGSPFNNTEESTAGISLCDWQMPNCQSGTVTAHVWDFAGQVITHSLHQFFLSERSIYILVLTGRENSEEDDAEYWLRLIMAFGKDEQGNPPPVIVTLNKWDDQGCRPKLDREVIQERYPCIVSFIETDCKSNLGVNELKQTLTKTTNSLPWVSQVFPGAWTAARDEIVKAREHSPHLLFADFCRLCKINNIKEQQDQFALADILHVLGIALNYRRDNRLREATVLQANWLTQNVYALLRFAETHTGILTMQDRETVLADEPDPNMRDYLMQIMERFEVAYAAELGGKTVWLLPQALPDSQPKAAAPLANSEIATRLRYTYSALPEGLLARAIVRMHEFIEIEDGNRLQWAKGVILTMDGARALLRANPRDRQVTLTVIGQEPARRKLAGLCRSHMRAIHADIHGLNPKEESQVQGQWLDIAVVEADEKHNGNTPLTIPGQATRMISAVAVSDAYNSETARNDAWKPKVFISYSKSNVRQRNCLVNQLQILANEGLMAAHWHDRMIIPGEDWHEKIQAELHEADLIVLLLSNDALGTEYITKHEIPAALNRHDAKEARFVPVILEECRWTKFESDTHSQLSDLNALPEKGKPIDTWRPKHNAGWKSVGDGLALVLKGIFEDAKREGKLDRRRGKLG